MLYSQHLQNRRDIPPLPNRSDHRIPNILLPDLFVTIFELS